MTDKNSRSCFIVWWIKAVAKKICSVPILAVEQRDRPMSIFNVKTVSSVNEVKDLCSQNIE